MSASAATFRHEGGEGTVQVSAARECTWTAESEVSWIAVPVGDGQGSAAVTFAVAANAAPAPRSGRVRVGGQPVTVRQEAAPCRIELDRAALSVPAQGGERDVRVSVLAGCGWQARTDAPWLAVTAGASGSGAGTVRVRAGSNDGAERTARLFVGERSVLVTQAAAGTSPAPEPEPEPGPDPAPDSAPEPEPEPEPEPPPPPPAPPDEDDEDEEDEPHRGDDPDSGDGNGSGGSDEDGPEGGNPDDENGQEKVSLSGRAASITGTCPALTFNLKGTTVITDADTRFRNGGCGDLERLNNAEVHVQGWRLGDDRVLAAEVDLL